MFIIRMVPSVCCCMRCKALLSSLSNDPLHLYHCQTLDLWWFNAYIIPLEGADMPDLPYLKIYWWYCFYILQTKAEHTAKQVDLTSPSFGVKWNSFSKKSRFAKASTPEHKQSSELSCFVVCIFECVFYVQLNHPVVVFLSTVYSILECWKIFKAIFYLYQLL